MTDEERFQKVVCSVKRLRKSGAVISTGVFLDGKKICPLMCTIRGISKFVGEEKPNFPEEFISSIQKSLKLETSLDAWNLINGIDSHKLDIVVKNNKKKDRFTRLGIRIGKEIFGG